MKGTRTDVLRLIYRTQVGTRVRSGVKSSLTNLYLHQPGVINTLSRRLSKGVFQPYQSQHVCVWHVT